jgi:hypothetical protein
MKFWEYNSNKVFYIAILSFLCGIVFFMLVGLTETDALSVLLMAGIGCAVTTIIIIIRGLNFFRTMKRITEDDTARSITELFDEGYTIILHNEHSRFFYTTESLKGEIAGMPVIVSFSQGSRASWPALVFSFYPLYHATLGNRTSKYLSFKLSIRNRLRKDIKPEVLQFVKDMKARGYASAEYSNYFVTAN